MDTSVWVDVLRGVPGARDALDSDLPLYTHPLVLAELTAHARAGRLDAVDPAALVEEVSEMLDVTRDDARAAGDTWARLRKNPKSKVGILDCLLHAAARRVGAVLVTRDGDLRKEAGVMVVA